MLFFRANETEATRVKLIINEFEAGTGQLINPSKYSIIFSPTCAHDNQKAVRTILNVEQQFFDIKYPGLPTPDGRMH
jgi:hypothetical protein